MKKLLITLFILTSFITNSIAATTQGATNFLGTISTPGLKVTTSPKNGGLLTSDNSGNATWGSGFGLPNFRAKLANVQSGIGNARVCIAGDSTMFGSYSVLSNSGDLITHSMPTQLSGYLNTTFGIKSDWNGFIGDGLDSETYGVDDPRIVMGSSWTQDSTIFSLGGRPFKASTTTNSLDFTPTTQVDTFRFLYITQSGGGVLAVNIDSGGATTYNTNTTAGVASATLTTTLGTHTIHFKYSSGGTVDLIGVSEAYDSSQSWVHIINMGAPDAAAANWATSGTNYNPASTAAWSALSCDLTIYEGGINDWFDGVTTGNFSTSMQTTITAMKASGDLALLTPIPSSIPLSGVSAATQQSFIGIFYTLANTNNVPLIDIFTRWQSYAIANSMNLYSTNSNAVGLHPNGFGYGEEALAIAHVLGSMVSQVNNEIGFMGGQIFPGNVGIGTITPGQILDVTGTVRTTNLTLTSLNSGTQCLHASSSGVVTGTGSDCGTNYWLNDTGNVGINTTYNIGIGTISQINTLNILGNIGIGTLTNDPYLKTAAPNGGMIIGGNVGIGTYAPRATLEVGGSGNVGIGTVVPASLLSVGSTSNYQVNNSGIIPTYNNISTVNNGQPAEVAVSNLTSQSAAITATTLYAVPTTGYYRVLWTAIITTAGTSSTLGGTTGLVLKYTSPDDSVVKTETYTSPTLSAANTTGTAISGDNVAYCKAGTNLQYLFGYTSAGTAMVYSLHIVVEAL